MREHKQKIAAFKKESANGGESHERTEEDLFRRLDELELEEELQHELDLYETLISLFSIFIFKITNNEMFL